MRDEFILLRNNKNISRRVTVSRPVCLGLKDRFHSKGRFDPNVESKRFFVAIAILFKGVIWFLQE